jgi:hypothetical protein
MSRAVRNLKRPTGIIGIASIVAAVSFYFASRSCALRHAEDKYCSIAKTWDYLREGGSAGLWITALLLAWGSAGVLLEIREGNKRAVTDHQETGGGPPQDRSSEDGSAEEGSPRD